jgi:hypothetical protein
MDSYGENDIDGLAGIAKEARLTTKIDSEYLDLRQIIRLPPDTINPFRQKEIDIYAPSKIVDNYIGYKVSCPSRYHNI